MDASANSILTLYCPDRVGIVARLARHMEAHGCFIASSRTFGDPVSRKFFARLEFEAPASGAPTDAFTQGLEELALDLAAACNVWRKDALMKTLILVSKSDHCANTLLYAAKRGELPIEIVGLVSNHDTLKPAFSHWGLPWHHVPITAATKTTAEDQLFSIIEQSDAEVVVLARYMQVLSSDACHRLAGRCINIHHSFLPGFKGARPYHQAHARGVKTIGASAHYVTPDLDEGPIIAQVTEMIDHTFSVHDMIETGRHLEGNALLRAVKAHAEHRVFLNSGKTIVFAR